MKDISPVMPNFSLFRDRARAAWKAVKSVLSGNGPSHAILATASGWQPGRRQGPESGRPRSPGRTRERLRSNMEREFPQADHGPGRIERDPLDPPMPGAPMQAELHRVHNVSHLTYSDANLGIGHGKAVEGAEFTAMSASEDANEVRGSQRVARRHMYGSDNRASMVQSRSRESRARSGRAG